MPGTVPSLKRIDASEPQKIIECMEENGCVIVKNFTTLSLVSAVNSETRPYLEADKPWKGDLFPPETRRCTRLVSRSPTVRQNWLLHPILSQLTTHFIDKTTHNFYGENRHTYTSKAIINISLTMEIGPGAKAQRLHRDDKNFHVEHRDQVGRGYRRESDVLMGVLIPGTEVTRENGGTWVIPGSHLWDDERAPLVSEVEYATMEIGDAFVMLGSTYHAGGANATSDQKRPLHGLFFCRGYYRSEENQYLIHDKEEVLSWTPEVQAVMGYNISSPNIGFVDWRQPVDWLRGDGYDVESYGDADPSQEVVPWFDGAK